MPTIYSVVDNQPARNATLQIHEFEVEANGDGSVDSVNTDSIHGWVALMEVVPDLTDPPAALFDITLKTSNGIDILGGQGEQLSNSVPAQFIPQVGEGIGTRPVHGVLTFACSNIGASKKFKIIMTVEK